MTTTRVHAAPHHVGRPPWEIGRPQPTFRALAEAGAIQGRVLDVGCGTGEHVLLAARRGLEATGLDLDETALESARSKAAQRGLTARFVRGDARHLGQLAERFDTVLDSELFHSLTGSERDAYIAGLRAILRPGGRYFMLCFSSVQVDVPHGLRRRDILDAFGDGWHVDSIRPVRIDTNAHSGGAHGWLAALTRTTDSEEKPC